MSHLLLVQAEDRRSSDEESLHLPVSLPSNSSRLFTYISETLIEESSPHETTCHWIARRTLQVVGPLLACAAKLSFITLSVEAAGSNKALGGLLAYGNITSFSIIISWCALNMIRDLMAPKSETEKKIEEARVSRWLKMTIATASFVLGVFAQFSLAYLVYVYNNNNILMPIAVMVSDPWFPVYSTWSGLSKLARQRNYSVVEKEIAEVKQDHIAGLRRAQGELTSLSSEERRIFRERLSSNTEGAEGYNHLLLERKVEVLPQTHPIYRIVEKAIFAIGLIFLLSQYLVIIYTGFAGWKLIWDQAVFDGFMTSIVLGAFLYITGVSIPNAAVRLFNLVTGLLCCSYQPTLAQKSAPIPATILTLLTLFTTFLSWGPNKEVATDYFHGWLQTAMLVTAPVSVVLLTTSIVLLVADIALEQFVSKFGDADARADMLLKWKYDDYIRVLDKCSVQEYAKFLKALPPESLNRISSKAEDLVDRLESYNSHTEHDSLLDSD